MLSISTHLLLLLLLQLVCANPLVLPGCQCPVQARTLCP